MKYYIIAGEASGDLHASNLIQSLKELDVEADFRAWGGDMMHKSGADVVKHYKDLAFMGFWEVAKNIMTIKENFRFCKADILEYKPDAIIFVDYPGFNLRMAKWAKLNNFSTHYYISPTIWAWHTSRIKQIKAYVDQMFTILPFEDKFYEKLGYTSQYVGHPLLDAIDHYKIETSNKEVLNRIALLPGSRKQELEKILPVFAEVVSALPEHNFELAAVPWQSPSFYKSFFPEKPENLVIKSGKTYEILSNTDAAIVTSGTATLETALFKVPQIVVYKTSALTYALAKNFAKVKFISLPNLILDQELVKELIQSDCNAQNIKRQIKDLFNSEKRIELLAGYELLHQKLGNKGASKRVADSIYKHIKK